MGATTFEDFRDVLNTAAGNACRCSRSALADTIARLAPGAALWGSPELEANWAGLTSELAALGITVRVDSSPTTTRDQPWGITTARAAISESGSVILKENRLNERSVSLMTERLIVLCASSNLHPSLDDAARILREIAAEGSSYATLVSGPSRTADIERQLTIGVQGPGELHVIVVDDEYIESA